MEEADMLLASSLETSLPSTTNNAPAGSDCALLLLSVRYPITLMVPAVSLTGAVSLSPFFFVVTSITPFFPLEP